MSKEFASFGAVNEGGIPPQEEDRMTAEQEDNDLAGFERANRERFFEEYGATLTAPQAEAARRHMAEHPGAWNQYDGQDVFVTGQEIQGAEWVVGFCIDVGQGFDEVEERIPLSA